MIPATMTRILMTVILLLAGNMTQAQQPDWAMDPEPNPDRIRVLIRGDDFGLTHASNLAMQEAFTRGQMTSASVMPSGAWFQETAAMIRAHPEWSIGLHLAMSSGWNQLHFGPLLPPSDVPTLVAADGYFYHSYPEWPLGLWILEEPPYLFSGEGEMPAEILDRRRGMTATEYPDPAEFEAELRAQIQRAQRLGIRFEYIDVHMGGAYVSALRPVLFKLAKELDMPIPEDGWMGYEIIHLRFWTDGAAASKTLASKLRSLEPGLYRIVLHPLIDNDEARAMDSFFGANWAREGQAALDALTSEEVKNAIAEMNIELVTVGDLWDYEKGALKDSQ